MALSISITPRDYQKQILAEAIEKNVIAFIDTGSGKTLISFLLIKEM
jgi:ERCC4-related helicase